LKESDAFSFVIAPTLTLPHQWGGGKMKKSIGLGETS
jgi:hypothetical protein